MMLGRCIADTRFWPFPSYPKAYQVWGLGQLAGCTQTAKLTDVPARL